MNPLLHKVPELVGRLWPYCGTSNSTDNFGLSMDPELSHTISTRKLCRLSFLVEMSLIETLVLCSCLYLSGVWQIFVVTKRHQKDTWYKEIDYVLKHRHCSRFIKEQN